MEENYRGVIKKILWDRDGEQCGICGEVVAFDEATIDHVQPQSRGGSWEVTNLQLAHSLCNAVKNNRTVNGLIDRPQKKSMPDKMVRVVLSGRLRERLFGYSDRTGLSLSDVTRCCLAACLENVDAGELDRLIAKLEAKRAGTLPRATTTDGEGVGGGEGGE